jgi:hypothetical protein
LVAAIVSAGLFATGCSSGERHSPSEDQSPPTIGASSCTKSHNGTTTTTVAGTTCHQQPFSGGGNGQ